MRHLPVKVGICSSEDVALRRQGSWLSLRLGLLPSRCFMPLSPVTLPELQMCVVIHQGGGCIKERHHENREMNSKPCVCPLDKKYCQPWRPVSLRQLAPWPYAHLPSLLFLTVFHLLREELAALPLLFSQKGCEDL